MRIKALLTMFAVAAVFGFSPPSVQAAPLNAAMAKPAPAAAPLATLVHRRFRRHFRHRHRFHFYPYWRLRRHYYPSYRYRHYDDYYYDDFPYRYRRHYNPYDGGYGYGYDW